jgi:hypothetical protein
VSISGARRKKISPESFFKGKRRKDIGLPPRGYSSTIRGGLPTAIGEDCDASVGSMSSAVNERNIE